MFLYSRLRIASIFKETSGFSCGSHVAGVALVGGIGTQDHNPRLIFIDHIRCIRRCDMEGSKVTRLWNRTQAFDDMGIDFRRWEIPAHGHAPVC